MSYVITGTNSAGVLSLKRDSAVAAIKKAVELMGDGTRDVHITDPDGRIYSDAEFSQLYMAARTQSLSGAVGRNRAVTTRRFAESLRRAKFGSGRWQSGSSLSAWIRRIWPGAAADVASRQTRQVDLWGEDHLAGTMPHVG